MLFSPYFVIPMKDVPSLTRKYRIVHNPGTKPDSRCAVAWEQNWKEPDWYYKYYSSWLEVLCLFSYQTCILSCQWWYIIWSFPSIKRELCVVRTSVPLSYAVHPAPSRELYVVHTTYYTTVLCCPPSLMARQSVNCHHVAKKHTGTRYCQKKSGQKDCQQMW